MEVDENVFVYFNLYASTKMLIQLDRDLRFLNKDQKMLEIFVFIVVEEET